eukprot:12228924-Heterocapsa_arctica.AAC.1
MTSIRDQPATESALGTKQLRAADHPGHGQPLADAAVAADEKETRKATRAKESSSRTRTRANDT